MVSTLPRWPEQKDIERQAKLAEHVLQLSKITGYSMADLLVIIRKKVETAQADTAEEGLRQLYEAFHIPAPIEGQMYFIIKNGALLAPGEEIEYE